MAGYNHIVTAGPLIEDDGTGRIHQIPGFGPQVFYRLTDRDAAKVTRGVELTAEAMFAAGARRVLLPFDGAPPIQSPKQARKLLANPVPKQVMRLFSIHLMGTARMSEDPRRGVTNSHGEFHGIPNLMIADASLFPGPTGLNPMETVIALVARNAQHLITHRTRYGI
jgi:choline dehydrogenase-like flavoprotein